MGRERGIWNKAAAELIRVGVDKGEVHRRNTDLTENQAEKFRHNLRRKAFFKKELKKRENPKYPKTHHGNLGSSNTDDIDLEEVDGKATSTVLNKLKRSFEHNKKPIEKRPNLRELSQNRNFTPYIKTFEKYARFKLERVKKELRKKVRLLRSNDRTQPTRELREQAEMSYHKAHKISFLINEANPSSQIFDKESHDLLAKLHRRFTPVPALLMKERLLAEKQNILRDEIKTLRKFLFANPKEESPKEKFMAGLFYENGRRLKELAQVFIGNKNTDNLEIYYYGSYSHRKEDFSPVFIELTKENQPSRNGVTNEEVRQLLHKTKEIPVAQIRNKKGEILFEISFYKGVLDLTNPTIPNDPNIFWSGGNIHFYHRQKDVKTEEIIKKIIEVSEEPIRKATPLVAEPVKYH